MDWMVWVRDEFSSTGLFDFAGGVVPWKVCGSMRDLAPRGVGHIHTPAPQVDVVSLWRYGIENPLAALFSFFFSLGESDAGSYQYAV